MELSRHLLCIFAKGEISATTVHELASAAWTDGWGRECPLGRRLVRAGSGGINRSHIANDILKAAEEEGYVCSTAKPYEITLATGGTMEFFFHAKYIRE